LALGESVGHQVSLRLLVSVREGVD